MAVAPEQVGDRRDRRLELHDLHINAGPYLEIARPPYADSCRFPHRPNQLARLLFRERDELSQRFRRNARWTTSMLGTVDSFAIGVKDFTGS